MRVAVTLTVAAFAQCFCKEWSGLNDYLESDPATGMEVLKVSPAGSSGTVYTYDASYGVGGCAAHDMDTDPFCTGRFPPAWCYQAWCYVDKDNCDKTYVRSKYFMTEQLYFSYGACGSSNSFQTWYVEGGAETKDKLGPLIELVEQYVKSNKVAAESTPADVAPCGVSQGSCPCTDCSDSGQYWPNKKVSFEDITMLPGKKSSGEDDGTCLGQGVSTTYLNMASSEYDDRTRVGYQYFGHQDSGAYGQWPLTDLTNSGSMCDDYDPRFRPWYASTATGPKDVVLVLDKSGSMGTAGRINLARTAALAVIDTLSDYDYVGVVLFNNDVMAYKEYLVPATPDNKGEISSYINSNLVDAGGTNFIDSLTKAFDILQASLDAGTTSMCMRAVMFLTDGQAEFYDTDYTATKKRVKELSVALFTYALGEGAEKTITKNLACQNRGVFYNIADGGDLDHIMASYYQYFALGTKTCSVRWIEYGDSITGETLLAGCMPFYDPATSQKTAPLRGVSCVDLNVIAELETVKQQANYDAFKCQTSQISMMCEPLYLRDVDLADMRNDIEAAETCPGDTPGQYSGSDGYCVDPECTDDVTFKDVAGYYCDQWVGEDCSRAHDDFADWGYTQAAEDAILAACPYSCLLCGRMPTAAACANTCDEVTGNIPCMPRIKPAGSPSAGGDSEESLAAHQLLALFAIGWTL
jgi:uncharacterized protein YegL